MEQKAVVDRFEGSLAVVLIGDQEKKALVPRTRLPAGVKEGDWLRITLSNGEISSIRPDPQETGQRRRLIAAKLEQLRNKSSQ